MELAATRFMYWTAFFGVDLMLWMVILKTHAHPFSLKKSTPGEITMLGFACAGISITLQQWFWWVNEQKKEAGDCGDLDPSVYNAAACLDQAEWYAYADATMILYFTAVMAAPMIANIPLRMVAEKHWYLFGASLAPLAWGIGYLLAWAKVGA